MKLAVISDIHGNYEALLQVLNKAETKGVEHLLVLGDIVGYYYHPDKVLALLEDWSYDIIKGNHETIMENLIADPSIGESIRLKYGSGHKEAVEKLNDDQINFLIDLPETKSLKINNLDILMCHGSPWANDFYIYPDCDSNILSRCDSSMHDFVLIGHSHYAFAVKNEHSVLLNPGSVGQSRQIGGRASWAMIDTENKSFQLLTTGYNVEKLLHEVNEKDAEIKYLTKILNRE
ncbi:metallophosphoesterase family protein [Maribacter sp. CXY002]|uniref:metallophosphoesterase family protein n=1 Tax=Maribacter luteocoastalis TaxID=3407671 RepID=UPI003B673F93